MTVALVSRPGPIYINQCQHPRKLLRPPLHLTFGPRQVDITTTMEKETYDVSSSPDHHGSPNPQYVDPATGVESKSGRILEAGEIYGNLDDAEQYGYVARGYVTTE